MATATVREVFDPALAREVWPAAEFWQNPTIPYCRFIFRTPKNGMRLEVGINFFAGSPVAISLHLATFNCIDIYGGPPSHQVPVVIRLWNIEKIRYDVGQGTIGFCQRETPSGERSITVCADGRFVGGLH